MMRGMLSLFRRIEVFDETYLPENFLHRDREIEEIMACVKPLEHGIQGYNALLHGKPATGKTTAVQKVFQQIEESSSRIRCVYVNVALKPSAWGTLAEACLRLTGQNALPDKGTGVIHLVDSIFRKLSKENNSLVLCLDEFTSMPTKELQTVVAPFLRPWEFSAVSREVKTSIILVSSSLQSPRFRSAVVSSLCPRWIEFKPYSAEQMRDILKVRAEAGFGPRVVSDEALWLLATAAKDLRHAIRLLRLAGEIAESRGTKVGVNDVEKAFERLPDSYVAQMRLSEAERRILDEIRSRGSMRSGEIYSFSERELGLKRTRTRQILASMIRKGILNSETVNHRGLTKVFTVARGWNVR